MRKPAGELGHDSPARSINYLIENTILQNTAPDRPDGARRGRRDDRDGSEGRTAGGGGNAAGERSGRGTG